MNEGIRLNLASMQGANYIQRNVAPAGTVAMRPYVIGNL